MPAVSPSVEAVEMQLELKYDGPALESGRMNARDLAPAILAFADAVERTAELTYRGNAQVHVEVNADFRRGSFAIQLLAVATPGELLPVSVDHLANIATLLGISVVPGVTGLWQWVKRQAGRPVEKVDQHGDVYHITVQGGGVLQIDAPTFNLFSDTRLRADLEKIVEPLERPGINTLVLGPPDSATPPVVVAAAERPIYSHNLAPAEELGIERGNAWLKLLAPSFVEGNKWRFERDGDPFYAEILDQPFLRRVARGDVKFVAGDTFRVLMQTRVTRTPDRLHYDRAILRVLTQWTHVNGETVKISFAEGEAESGGANDQ